MSGTGRWSDLTARIGSAVVMVVIGLAAIVAGSHVFHIFIAVLCGAMVWELVRMLSPETPQVSTVLGAMAGAAVLMAIYVPGFVGVLSLLVPVVAGVVVLPKHRAVFGAYAALIVLAGVEMTIVRDAFGLVWIIWLVLVVIASDVGGYFAGRLIGGPKFWPKVSPKKTWSGTIAGWIGAALVGAWFMERYNTGVAFVPFSVLVAFSAQLGDIAESAVKRLVGVKDSSNLIPGHGGLLDRFDGMLGAAFFVLLIRVLIGPLFGTG